MLMFSVLNHLALKASKCLQLASHRPLEVRLEYFTIFGIFNVKCIYDQLMVYVSFLREYTLSFNLPRRTPCKNA